MDNPRCPRCDRAECRREVTWHAYAEADCTDAARELRDASCAAQVDCDAHAVDWRARALAAEQALTTAREDERRRVVVGVATATERIEALIAIAETAVTSARFDAGILRGLVGVARVALHAIAREAEQAGEAGNG